MFIYFVHLSKRVNSTIPNLKQLTALVTASFLSALFYGRKSNTNMLQYII